MIRLSEHQTQLNVKSSNHFISMLYNNMMRASGESQKYINSGMEEHNSYSNPRVLLLQAIQ